MNLTELSKRINKAGMPFVWQFYSIVLFFLVCSTLFITDSVIKYSLDISIAVLNIIAITSGFFICKKKLMPWGALLIAITLLSSSFIINSLIFFGFQTNTQLPFWIEITGVVFTAFFCISLLYLFEKQYKLKGVTIDFTLMALSATCLVFLVYPNLLDIVLYQLNKYEQSLVFKVALGTAFFSTILMAGTLINKIKFKNG